MKMTNSSTINSSVREIPLEIPLEDGALGGILAAPAETKGIVLFVHGSGSGRLSPRNIYVADLLHQQGFATLLFDLLTGEEKLQDEKKAQLRFNVDLLAARLIFATDWLREKHSLFTFPFGYFGASTGAAAALVAATKRPYIIKAIVSRAGRPDLAGPFLPFVQAPVLLIAGENDPQVVDLNRRALEKIPAQNKKLKIIPQAGHLFEEPGKLEEVGRLAREWFSAHMLKNGGQHENMHKNR